MRQSKIIFTGYKKFSARNNCSTLQLLSKLQGKNVFLFTNDYASIKKEVSELLESDWDRIIMFGQKPVVKKLYVEKCACYEGEKLTTNWNLEEIEVLLNTKFIDFKFSENAGHYYCNYAYFQMLKQVRDRGLKTKVIFVHIPYVDRFRQFEEVIQFLDEYQ